MDPQKKEQYHRLYKSYVEKSTKNKKRKYDIESKCQTHLNNFGNTYALNNQKQSPLVASINTGSTVAMKVSLSDLTVSH